MSTGRPSDPPRSSLRDVSGWLSEHLVEIRNSDDTVVVTGITLNSQQVRPGDLYVAPAGAHAHGADYADQAVVAGAVAVLTDEQGADICADAGVPVLVVSKPRAWLGDLAAHIYGRPAQALRLVAVTGTQGKTTTTRLADQALQRSGVASAVIGTVGTRIDGVELTTSLTTPEAPALHALFAVMREQGVKGCAMEVSSHALVMGRVDGVVFDVAAFTNLGRDHLDFHPTMEDYFAAKASLFTPQRSRLGLVNIDDAYGRRLVAEASVPIRTFSTDGADADWSAHDIEMSPTSSSFTVWRRAGDRFPAVVPLAGGFNVSNALCAIALLGEAGFDPVEVALAMAGSGGVPGRLERIDVGQDFLAIVDYAHKPDAITAALGALRTQTPGRMVVVLGAGGDRDEGKRSIMGEVASRLANVVVVTDDNPRSEDPAAIRAAVLAGATSVTESERAELHDVGDRRQAIRLAVSLAKTGDTVVIAGKGHEAGQEILDTVHPFDDRSVLAEEIAGREMTGQ